MPAENLLNLEEIQVLELKAASTFLVWKQGREVIFKPDVLFVLEEAPWENHFK